MSRLAQMETLEAVGPSASYPTTSNTESMRLTLSLWWLQARVPNTGRNTRSPPTSTQRSMCCSDDYREVAVCSVAAIANRQIAIQRLVANTAATT